MWNSEPPRPRRRRWTHCWRDPPPIRSVAPSGSMNWIAACKPCFRPVCPRMRGWRTSMARGWSISSIRPCGTPGCAWRPRGWSTLPAPSGSTSRMSPSGRHPGHCDRPTRPMRLSDDPACRTRQANACVRSGHRWTLPPMGTQDRMEPIRTGFGTDPRPAADGASYRQRRRRKLTER